MILRADLHIHSCLSPCADDGMTPQRIVRAAKEKGLKMIAVADHNSCENAAAAVTAAAAMGLCNLPAMEVTTREEVHILALFPDLTEARAFQEKVYGHLPGKNRPELFGNQWIVDHRDQRLGCCERLLLGSTTLPLKEVVHWIHRYDGLAIAAHVDREAFGLIGQLGFVPEGVPLDGFECSTVLPSREIRRRLPLPAEAPVLASSDAHDLHQIGQRHTLLRVRAAGFDELSDALKGFGGRAVVGWNEGQASNWETG